MEVREQLGGTSSPLYQWGLSHACCWPILHAFKSSKSLGPSLVSHPKHLLLQEGLRTNPHSENLPSPGFQCSILKLQAQAASEWFQEQVYQVGGSQAGEVAFQAACQQVSQGWGGPFWVPGGGGGLASGSGPRLGCSFAYICMYVSFTCLHWQGWERHLCRRHGGIQVRVAGCLLEHQPRILVHAS